MIVNDIILKKNKTQYEIYIDNGQLIVVDLELVIELGIKKNMVVDERWLNNLIESADFKNAYNYSIRLLSIKDRTRGEIINKLLLRKYSMNTIDKVLEKLMSFDYINDEKYIENFLNENSIIPGISKKALFYKLIYKGLDKDLVKQKLYDIKIDDYKSAVLVATKKVKTINGDLTAKRKKLYLFLKSKGFCEDICCKAIKDVLNISKWE